MKILKLLFSKWGLSVLLILLQLSIIGVAITIGYEYFWIIQFVTDVAGVVVFFLLINKDQNTDFKIPWLFLILFVPVLGTLLYLMFGRNRMKKKDYKFLNEIFTNLGPHAEKAPTKEELEAFLGEKMAYENYLQQASFSTGQLGNEVKYYPVGEKMWLDMIEALKGAREFILMEYFIVDPGKMWDTLHEILKQKAQEGVKVHFLYDDLGTMTMLPSGYYKTLRKEGIDAHKFNAVGPILTNVYNNRDHRKIMVVDGKVGFTGGINLGDEYINENHRLGHWKDTGIRIVGPAVRSLMTHFFSTYGLASHEVLEYHRYYKNLPEKKDNGGYVHFFGAGPTPAYTEAPGEGNFIQMLASAKKSFWITTPYLIIDYRFTMAIREAAMRGVDVRIVTPHIPDKKMVFCMTRSSYKSLRKAGVRIYEYTPGFIHAKMAVVDGEVAFVGTINMDFRSLTHHYECGALLYRDPCIKDIVDDFHNIFEVSQEIDDKFKLSFPAKIVNGVLAVFRALF